MRVAQVIANVQTGGAEHHLIDLLHGLTVRDIDCHVLAPREGPLTAALDQLNINVTCIEMVQARPGDEYAFDPRAFENVFQWLSVRQPDIVHSHLYPAHLHASLAAHERGLAAIVHTAHTLVVRPGDVLLARTTAARTIATSHAVQRALVGAGVPERCVEIIYNGIGPHHLSVDPAAVARARSALDLAPGPIIGTVARLSSEKRIDVLIAAVPDIRASFPGVQVVIVGDGPARAKLEQVAGHYGVGEHVRFTGIRDDIAALNRVWDVFVLPSADEACPLALLEAMAAARAVVVPAAGGSADVVQHSVTGWLFVPGDPHALARGASELLRDAGLREQLGAAAQRQVATEFTVDRMVDQTLALYRRLVG
jgi:glycosyltransferase involved in cell wall biosynthesis